MLPQSKQLCDRAAAKYDCRMEFRKCEVTGAVNLKTAGKIIARQLECSPTRNPQPVPSTLPAPS